MKKLLKAILGFNMVSLIYLFRLEPKEFLRSCTIAFRASRWMEELRSEELPAPVATLTPEKQIAWEAPSSVPSTVVVPTVYGQILVNRHDIIQSEALFRRGIAVDQRQIDLLVGILKNDDANAVFVDIGASFGTFSLAFSRRIGPGGKVHAFEPQRHIYNLLVGSVALNAITNVHCYNMAIGDHGGTIEIPQFDYNRPMNFGSIEFAPEQREKIHQERGHDASRVETVPITTLDQFGFDRIDVIKIDVEGMENQVLDGATDTIKRCRPVMYIEVIKIDAEALKKRLLNIGYHVVVDGDNILCIPSESPIKCPINGSPGPKAVVESGRTSDLVVS